MAYPPNQIWSKHWVGDIVQWNFVDYALAIPAMMVNMVPDQPNKQ